MNNAGGVQTLARALLPSGAAHETGPIASVVKMATGMVYVKWWVNNWIGGTYTMTRLERGAYHDLLMAQANEGPLSEEKVRRILGDDYATTWPTVSQKFVLTEDGMYYNNKMHEEVTKAKAYRESRSGNAKHMQDTCPPYAEHTVSVLVSDVSSSASSGSSDRSGEQQSVVPKRFVAPSVDDVREYCSQRGNVVDPERFVDYYTANGWKVGKNAMKDWHAAVRTWEKNVANTATSQRKQYGRQEISKDELARQIKRDMEVHGEN